MDRNKITNWPAIILALILICIVIWGIYVQVEEFQLQDDPKLKELFATIQPMFSKEKKFYGILEPLNNRDILNEVTLYRGDSSYTINKEKIFLCLYDEKGEYYPDQPLLYVLLHEISHALCDEVGHTQKFHEIFEALLDEAAKEGIYNPSIPMIKNYCGT